MTTLFDPICIGSIELANRICMAPLTRNRASPGQVPNALMSTYYAQRANPAAGAGLLISEATQISPMGQGYLDTPGIHSAAQIAGWRQVTDAVHAQGGRIVVQLWHVGRISHSSLLPGGVPPVSSTARAAKVNSLTREGRAPCSTPRALRTEEIAGVVADYRQAALNAIEAGFDGVEVHGANGYLIDQFLRDSINDRSDAYGGPVANRARFLVEVMQAVVAAIGGGRTGLRLSPVTGGNDAAQDSQPQALMAYVVRQLEPLGLAFLHLIEGQTGGARDNAPFDYAALRRLYSGAWMVNNGYSRDMALQAVASGQADLVAFGKPFIANPDLGLRLRQNAEWNVPDSKSFYSGGPVGYTDYPTLEASRLSSPA